MASNSQKTNADLVRLQHAAPSELPDVLKDLLDRGEALATIAEIVERRIDNGTYVQNDQLARLVTHAESPSLYAKVREQLFKDHLALIDLYKGRYRDSTIEKTLCDHLYKIALNDAEPMRRYIVTAMRDVGSDDLLPTLEAILFDHAPTLKAKQVIANAIDSALPRSMESLLPSLEAKSSSEFLDLVADAITAIKNRDVFDNTSPAQSTPRDPSEERADRLYNANFEKQRAEQYIDADPVTAIMCVRRGAEAIGKDIYRLLGYEDKGKPARKMTLEDLLKPVKDSDAPEVFKHCIQTLQLFGNFAAHDQDDQSRFLTKEIALPLLHLYDQALKIYTDWSAEKLCELGK